MIKNLIINNSDCKNTFKIYLFQQTKVLELCDLQQKFDTISRLSSASILICNFEQSQNLRCFGDGRLGVLL